MTMRLPAYLGHLIKRPGRVFYRDGWRETRVLCPCDGRRFEIRRFVPGKWRRFYRISPRPTISPEALQFFERLRRKL
jgi:hypothetical protein